jgi:hypothetical protein
MDKDMNSYLCSLVRGDIRAKECALTKLRRKPNQTILEAEREHLDLSGRLAFSRDVLDQLRNGTWMKKR